MAEEKSVQELFEGELPEVCSVGSDARLRSEPWLPYPGEGAVAAPDAAAVPRARRRLSYFASLAMLPLLLAFVGFVWESKVTARDAREYPMLGQLVDVGGYRLHLYCTGTGSPTVVLDAGFDDSTYEWKRVQQQIARTNRACSFDRAGLGWSDPGPLPRTARKMEEEIYAALNNAGVQGPYLLVGHSYGGLTMLMFASQHPAEVFGTVLVDSVLPDHYPPFPSRYSDKFLSALYPIAAPFGLSRLLGGCPIGPPSCRQYAKTIAAQRGSREESSRQVRAASLPAHMPLTVIAHDPEVYLRSNLSPEKRRLEQTWDQWQQDLARASSNSTFIVAKNTGHEIPAKNPQIVIDAIVETIQSNRPR